MIKLLILSFIFLITKCDSTLKITSLNKEHNGKQIQISQNQKITITLDSNPTTGYIWTNTDSSIKIIRQIKKTKFKASSKKMGAGGKQSFIFEAKDIGDTELKLIYHRPWEKNIAPIDTFIVNIKIVK